MASTTMNPSEIDAFVSQPDVLGQIPSQRIQQLHKQHPPGWVGTIQVEGQQSEAICLKRQFDLGRGCRELVRRTTQFYYYVADEPMAAV